ncbi:MAG: DUF3108 domain-containing protein [Acidobacteriia bacterium]|nr:DUF3108 domain-containing protein [Terriglobia bacterium]
MTPSRAIRGQATKPPKFGGFVACPRIARIALAVLALACAAPAQTGFPFKDESLHYSINWPSGLSVGEAAFSAHRAEAGWDFEMSLNAGIPGFSVADKIRSSASAELCSKDLDRDISQGSRKSREKTTFDQKKGTARRVTTLPDGGGKTDFDVPACARDALTFLYYARRELGQGRVPSQQQVYYGSAYSVRMEYTGAQTIRSGDRPSITDRVVIYVKGPKADFNFEAFFARDAARTPLSIRVPLGPGTFSMDLAP